MSADNNEGPRCGSDSHDGAYQYPALASGSGGAVIDLSAWAGEYIDITWIPPAGQLLYYGFSVDATDAELVFDDSTATDPGVAGTKVERAPKKLTGAVGLVSVTVPRERLFLRLESSADTGICDVHHAEASKQSPASGGPGNPT